MGGDLAACRHGAGTRRSFWLHPLQTLGALARWRPPRFWQRIVFSALRILAGFLLAAAGGCSGAAGAHVGIGYGYSLPCHAADTRHAGGQLCHSGAAVGAQCELSVIVSFTHVLPVVYAGVLGGIADTDPKLLEMAKVYRLPLSARLRYIWLPGIFPSFC